ncbi:MAG TPA: HD-GYP domain-containing protein [Gemmatimonadales bacterium]|jgi:putative nucleotidyltransferase with HDIG domain|nr:HD-GYP domain-containing protein [Gemmatimonadales bacterium]
MDINRGRLIQERWLTLMRWLLIEAYVFQTHLEGDLSRVLEGHLSAPLLGFAAYTLVVTLLVALRGTWPVGLAYLTATIDTGAAVLFAAGWSSELLNPGLAGVAAAGIAAGVRRFPVFETFTYSFLIAVGLVAARVAFAARLPLDLPDVLFVGAAALLPVLARATTLAPQQGARDDPITRLSGQGLRALEDLPVTDGDYHETLYHAGAMALASYTESSLTGVLVRNSDGSMDLFSVVDERPQRDRLPPVTEDHGDPGPLPLRILAVREPAALTRRDNLDTRGLPDQYPPRLDSLLIVPLPNVSEEGATLLAANRKPGPYREDDKVFAFLLARDIARLALAEAVGGSRAATRLAATEALLAAIEAKRPGSRAQAEECARLAEAIARDLGWADEAITEIRLAGLLHDVGELAVPDPVLDKPEPLAPDEYEVMQQHPRVAARMIDFFNRSTVVLNAVYSHHERWDGSGYPSGLAGESIPIEARIIGLADAVESMLSPKVYRPALDLPSALQEIVRGTGTQFDPTVVQAFLGVLEREGQSFLERAAPPEEPPAAQRGWGRVS